MNLLEELQAIPTGRTFPQKDRQQFVAEIRRDERGIKPQGFSVLNEYRLALNVGVNFECTPTMLEFSEPRAMKQLQRVLYGPFIEGIDEAINRIMSEDNERALKVLLRLSNMATGQIG